MTAIPKKNDQQERECRPNLESKLVLPRCTIDCCCVSFRETSCDRSLEILTTKKQSKETDVVQLYRLVKPAEHHKWEDRFPSRRGTSSSRFPIPVQFPSPICSASWQILIINDSSALLFPNPSDQQKDCTLRDCCSPGESAPNNPS